MYLFHMTNEMSIHIHIAKVNVYKIWHISNCVKVESMDGIKNMNNKQI